MKKSIFLAMIAAVVMCGCKKHEPEPPAPQQGLFTQGTDVAPQWEHIPSRETYNTMTAIVQIPDTFNAYLSTKDEIAVFSANGQLLASASPFQGVVNRYWLLIEQPKEGTALTLKWYCDRLTRVYTAQTFPDFVVNKMIGKTDPYVLIIK